MATAGSAVSTSEDNWEEFGKTAKMVKEELSNNVESLMKAMEEVREICNKFYKAFCNKIPSKPEEIKQLQDNLEEKVVKLKEELNKAESEELTIVFVGRTSSGKSSVINAILRDCRLPTGPLQTTMCRIQVRPTTDEKWSVIKIGCETPLSDQMSKKKVKALLSKLTGNSRAEWKKFDINSHSVIQVNWPRNLCSLPENIVLIDTPGSNENKDCDQVTLDSCKEADIIVAVMDFRSPSVQDKEEEEEEEEEGNQEDKGNGHGENRATINLERQQAREQDEMDFRNLVKGKSEVYFVDAKHVSKAKETQESIEGRENFLRFERDLAESAKCVKARKGVVLIEQAEALTSNYGEDFTTFKSIIEGRKKSAEDRLHDLNRKLSTMEKEKDSLDTVNKEVKKLDDLIRNNLADGVIDRLMEELENQIKACNSEKSEDEAIHTFFREKIGGINTSLRQQTEKVDEEHQKWKAELRTKYGASVIETLPSCESTEPKKPEDSGCDDKSDPHAFITSDNIWKNLLSSASLIAGVLPLLGRPKHEGIVVAATAAVAHTIVEHKRFFMGPSQERVKKVKEFVKAVLMKMREQFSKYKELIEKKINTTSEKISSEIEAKKERSSTEISTLAEELNQLQEWSKKITKSTNSLREVCKELDKLKSVLEGPDTVSPDDQTENQSPVQPVD